MGKFFNEEVNSDNNKKDKKTKKIKVKKVKEKKKDNEPVSFKIILINLLLFVFIIYIGSKAYLTYKYSTNDFYSLYNVMVFDLTYTSSKYELLSQTYESYDYLTYENVKVFNVFSFTTKENDNSKTFTLYDSDGEVETAFIIKIEENPLSEYLESYDNDEKNYFDLIFLSEDDLLIGEYLSVNNINNEYDLLLSMNEEINTTLLSSTDELKYNYAKGLLINERFTDGDKTLITGDYTGYIDIIEQDDIKITKYVLIKDNTNYSFTFYNSDYYTSNELSNIINSIVIE